MFQTFNKKTFKKLFICLNRKQIFNIFNIIFVLQICNIYYNNKVKWNHWQFGNSNDSLPIHVPVFSGLCIHAGGEESVWYWGGAKGASGPLLRVQLCRERGSYYIIRGRVKS